MNNELIKLILGFLKNNKKIVIFTIFFQALYASVESIVIPRVISGIINNVNNNEIFKLQLIKLLATWIIIKIVYLISRYYNKQLDPEISHYIILTILKSVFNKYEKENEITNVSILMSKIHLINSNLQDLLYLLCTVFIPRIIVLFFNCYNFFTINKKLGCVITVCVILQHIFITRGLSSCVYMTHEELLNKDKMYDYIEDIFYNINIVRTTSNGYDYELKNIGKISEDLRVKQKNTIKCVHNKQHIGYTTNIIIFSVILYTIYKLHLDKELNNAQVTTSILLMAGLFENMCDMAYYIPDLAEKLGILNNNEKFLKKLVIESENNKYQDKINFKNSNIEFRNVSFSYDSHMILKDFNIEISENQIVCLYGQSGSGKSTFIKLIFGIETPIQGYITIGGNDISNYKIKDIRNYISYVDQNTSHLFNKTIYENIVYGYDNIDKQRIKDIFEKFDLYKVFKNLDDQKEKWSFLDESAGRLGDNLSGGMKQIIYLLRLDFNNTTKIIILDEPSSALDENTRDNIIEFIKYLNSKGKTILLVTHDNFYKQICDKIILFSNDVNPQYQ